MAAIETSFIDKLSVGRVAMFEFGCRTGMRPPWCSSKAENGLDACPCGCVLQCIGDCGEGIETDQAIKGKMSATPEGNKIWYQPLRVSIALDDTLDMYALGHDWQPVGFEVAPVVRTAWRLG